MNDLGQSGIFSDSCSSASQESRLVGSCSRNIISGLLVDRYGFTCQSCFVDCGYTFNNNAVDRDVLARMDDKLIIDSDL